MQIKYLQKKIYYKENKETIMEQKNKKELRVKILNNALVLFIQWSPNNEQSSLFRYSFLLMVK